MNKSISRLLLVCFAGLLFFLTFNRHSKSGYFNYHSEIWADKAGYYSYLPAALKYDFKASNFPTSIDSLTGGGFKLDHVNDKVKTKVTYGVALLQLPFYLLADAFAPILNMEANGFSPVYHWGINVASICYLLLGLTFLQLFLTSRFRNGTTYLTLFAILLGTNLLYYSIDETGMSHVYSFALFSVYLFLLHRWSYLVDTGFSNLLLFGLISGLIILIRPTNVIFLSVFFFLDLKQISEFSARFKRLIQWRTILPISLGVFIILLPQMVYWYYLQGSPVFYSYENEGFNWMDPKIIETWFSPNNGLFLYTPFYFAIVGSVLFMLRKHRTNGMFFLVLFVALTYVLSSWWTWDFGCSFGARSYVEYLALFSLPLAFTIERANQFRSYKRIIFWILIIALVVFNLKLTYTFDECFHGTYDWDWEEYFRLVTSPTK